MSSPRRVSQTIRAVIVDDEALARDGIRLRLEGEPDVIVIGEYATAEAALAGLGDLEPDLIFVDIEMPGLNGLELLSRIGAGTIPAVVFVTAHHEHALEAFRVRALDYLVKPFDDERFGETMDRVRVRVSETRDEALGRRVRLAVREQAEPMAIVHHQKSIERIPVRGRRGVTFVQVDSVDWIEASGDYVILHVGDREHMTRETLSNMEAKLRGTRFARIHRSTIVNVERIIELQPFFHGDWVAILRGGKRLKVSRTRRSTLEQALGAEL